MTRGTTMGKNPTAKGQGRGIEWLRAHVNYSGDECLIFPLKTRRRGYAVVGINGKIPCAARVMCELVKGPPPTPKHEAAHSCGRGNKGCVNPKHLSWKTRAENQQDRRKHGTQGRGPNMTARRIAYILTPEKVAEIRAIGDSVTKEELGRRFGVTPSNIGKVLRRESWPSGDYTPRGFAKGDPRNPSVRRARVRALGEAVPTPKEGT